MFSKKKLAGMVLAKMPSKKKEDDEPSKEEFFHLAKRDAAARILKAVKDDDHMMLAHALSEFNQVCSEYEKESEE